jgi:endonuclease/exonuclease/phosphatase family metal-dependent hydrolase
LDKDALKKDYEIIIMGDFNERENDKKQRSSGLIKKLLKYELIDIHKFLFGNELKDTWSNGNTSSRIDYIFSSRNIVDNID